MRVIAVIALASLVVLPGCGQSPSSDAPTAKASNSNKPPKDWNAVDACSVLDKASYGTMVEKQIQSTSLSLAHESDGVTAATSQCTYETADGERFDVMLRWSPINDNTEGSINLTRNTLTATVKAFNGKVDTMTGLGKAAFWVDLTDTLNVFIGDDKMAIINVPASPKAKDQAIAIARKLGA